MDFVRFLRRSICGDDNQSNSSFPGQTTHVQSASTAGESYHQFRLVINEHLRVSLQPRRSPEISPICRTLHCGNSARLSPFLGQAVGASRRTMNYARYRLMLMNLIESREQRLVV